MDYEGVREWVLDFLERGLSKDLHYHGVHHTLEVLANVEVLADGEGVAGENLALLRTAALLHDSGFTRRYAANEELGCETAREILPPHGYSPEQTSRIESMIMATSIPQRPVDQLGEILCDADLGYLGTARYGQVSDSLRRELEAHGKTFTDSKWRMAQIDFLASHKYFTATAKRLWDDHKKNITSKLQEQNANIL